MKNFIRHKGMILIIAAIVIAVALAIYGAFLEGTAPPVDNALGFLLKPFRTLFLEARNWSDTFYEAMYRYDDLLAENDRLRLALARVEELARTYEEANSENERLRRLLALAEKRRDFTFVSASIVARDTSNWARTFTLSKGSDDGLAAGLPVVNDVGHFVGALSEVGGGWSTVTTLVDTDMDCGAYVYRTGLTGLAEGDFNLMQKGVLRLSYLPLDADVLNGDIVLTAGLGGLYPRGLEIGRITEVRLDDSGLSHYAVIEPSVALDKLTQVFIITDFDITE